MNPALIHLGLVLIAQAAPISVSELLSNRDRFHGQPVTVSGTISNFLETLSRRRTRYYTFDLSDGTETVHVTAYAKPPCQSGAAMVEGTFGQAKWRVNSSYYFEEITARNAICLPNAGEPREPKTK
jgi:hypothetical protein